MTDIGWWIRRPGGKWHLVESKVAGAWITKCGRFLVDVDSSSVMPLTRMIGQPQNCKVCDRESVQG